MRAMTQWGRQLSTGSAFVYAAAALIVLAAVLMHFGGCSPKDRAAIKTVLDVAPGTCVRIAKIYENGTVEHVCATADEILPLLPIAAVSPAVGAEPAGSSSEEPAKLASPPPCTSAK